MIYIKTIIKYNINNIVINNININLHNYMYNFNKKIMNIIMNKNNNLYKYYIPDNENIYNIICIMLILELYIITITNNITINYSLLLLFANLEYNNNLDTIRLIDIKYIYKAILNHKLISYYLYLEFDIFIKKNLLINYKSIYTYNFLVNIDINNINLLYKHILLIFLN